MIEDPIDGRVWRRADVVDGFLARRAAGIPGGDVQAETLLRLVADTGCAAPRTLDLGCGDGVLGAAVRDAFPGARLVAVDDSAAMRERAAERLRGTDAVVVAADLADPGWRDALPERTFDAVVSGFAIHHLEDARKRALYGEIFALLAPGGVFVNVEHVASASPRGEAFWEASWCEHAARATGERYESVLAAFRSRPDRDANRLAPVETQLAWLRESGFVDVDCYWKHFELAVLGAYRPGRAAQ